MTKLVLDVRSASQVVRLTLRTVVLFICSLGLSPPVSAQTQTAGKSDPALRFPPMEHSVFQQIRDPNEDDTPGALKYGGYLWRDVNVTQRSYRAVERKIGGAAVETIKHSSAYPYVIRDFFGTFRAVAAGPENYRHSKENTEIVNGAVSEANGQWRFMNWTTGDSATSGNICLFVKPKGEGTIGGIVGWYVRENGWIKTVMIRFDQLGGIPVELIDEYLKKYPSFVKESDFHGETWVGDDIQKWIHLLQLHKSDKVMFGMALGRLAAYDTNLFGVDPKRLNTDDNAMFEKVIQDVKLGAEGWLQSRATENR